MWAIKYGENYDLYAGTKVDWCKLTDEGVLKFDTVEDALYYWTNYIHEYHALIVEV
jgi:hypothetical protein